MNHFIILNGLFRGYLYNRWKSPKIELLIYNAKFAQTLDKLNKNNEDYHVTIEFKNDSILIRRSLFGNKIYPQVKSQVSTLSVGKLITLEEKYKIRKQVYENKGYYKKSIKVQINPSEWNLQFHEFFVESLEEQQLVKELAKKYEVLNITANSENAKRYGNGDIVLTYRQREVPIEITTHPPSCKQKEIKKGGNASHGLKWAKITSRILPMLIFSVENKSHSFVIIHNSWEKYQHTKDLKKRLQKSKCFLIYTNFQKDWEKTVIEEIEKSLGDKYCYVSELNRQPIPSL